MEQASGSIMPGIRAFSADLPLTSLLWPSTALRLSVYFQVNAGVSYFWVLLKTSTLLVILCIYIPLPLAVLSLIPPAVTNNARYSVNY